MTQEEVYARLQDVFDYVFIAKVVVTPELSAKDVYEWDSLSHVQLILAIEDELKIRFDLGDVAAARNVGDLVQLILARSAPA